MQVKKRLEMLNEELAEKEKEYSVLEEEWKAEKSRAYWHSTY